MSTPVIIAVSVAAALSVVIDLVFAYMIIFHESWLLSINRRIREVERRVDVLSVKSGISTAEPREGMWCE